MEYALFGSKKNKLFSKQVEVKLLSVKFSGETVPLININNNIESKQNQLS